MGHSKAFSFKDKDDTTKGGNYLGNIRGARNVAKYRAVLYHTDIYIKDYFTNETIDIIFLEKD